MSVVLAASVTPGCKRRYGGPTVAERKAFAALVVGTYGQKPDPNLTPYLPPPQVMLLSDGAFAMASIPAAWLSGYAAPGEKVFSARGKWTVGDDGDGSWEIFLDTTEVNGNPTAKHLRVRPFTDPGVGIMFDNPDYGTLVRSSVAQARPGQP
jgi:hypothetical protein